MCPLIRHHLPTNVMRTVLKPKLNTFVKRIYQYSEIVLYKVHVCYITYHQCVTFFLVQMYKSLDNIPLVYVWTTGLTFQLLLTIKYHSRDGLGGWGCCLGGTLCSCVLPLYAPTLLTHCHIDITWKCNFFHIDFIDVMYNYKVFNL